MTSHQNVDERIRQRAYQSWQREGCPEGRNADHWEAAREEIAIEDSQLEATKPNPAADGSGEARSTVAVEPVLAAESQGDMPGLTDQGEEKPFPKERDSGGTHVEVGALGERSEGSDRTP
ncbi:MAG TPA: DUF2934 domain-containing protein [Alphaproteobacteria bacterium]|nr:DUF2934 domain-containing protein [Alphaproteobacteria bacterium]